MLYFIGRGLFRAFFRLFFRYRVEGLERVPEQGGVLLVANHASYLDPPLLGSAMTRPVHFMAKAELFKIPGLNWALPRVKAFPVRRGAADRNAIRTAVQLLENGEVVGLFPEGTRTRTGELLPPQRGAGLIALKADVPVIPVALAGTFVPVRWKGLLPRFNRIVVRIGEPLDASALRKDDAGKENLDRMLSMAMEEIDQLLKKDGA